MLDASQATNHYLNQWWPSSFTHSCVTRYQLTISDVIMSAMASQITGVSIVCFTVCSCEDQRKHQSSVSMAVVRGIHRGPRNSPHTGPVTRKMSIWWRYHAKSNMPSKRLSPRALLVTIFCVVTISLSPLIWSVFCVWFGWNFDFKINSVKSDLLPHDPW